MRGTLQQRFEAKFNRLGADECWPWLAGKTLDGYGNFDVLGKSVGAHRVAYELYVGEIPSGMQVLHSCDNPSCVNPDHFWLGTHADNMADKGRKGRVSVGDRKGEKHPMVKLAAHQVLMIRSDPRSSYAVAKEFNISSVHVRKIRRKESWAHI